MEAAKKSTLVGKKDTYRRAQVESYGLATFLVKWRGQNALHISKKSTMSTCLKHVKNCLHVLAYGRRLDSFCNYACRFHVSSTCNASIAVVPRATSLRSEINVRYSSWCLGWMTRCHGYFQNSFQKVLSSWRMLLFCLVDTYNATYKRHCCLFLYNFRETEHGILYCRDCGDFQHVLFPTELAMSIQF